jgi:hypothetical protein
MCVAAIVVLALAPPSSEAGYVTTTFSGVSPGQVVTIRIGYAGQPGTVTESGWAGVYNFVNSTGDLTGSLDAFCIDVNQGISQGETVTFEVQPLEAAPTPGTAMGDGKADLIRELWGRDFALIGENNRRAAAFQIAVWEIINETSGTLNLSNGYFGATASDSATITLANSWLSELDGTGPMANILVALTSDNRQDYVVQGAPAPTGFVLGAIGALPLAFVAARRRRNQPITATTRS